LKNFTPGDKRLILPDNILEIMNFSNIRANDLTPTLTIEILSVNGVSTRQINETGFLRIDTDNLTQLHNLQIATENQTRTRELEAERRKQAEKERERARARAEKERKIKDHPLNVGYMGMFLQGGPMIGTDAGLVEFGISAGIKNISVEFGILGYPGISEDNIKDFIGTSEELGLTGGFCLSLLYSVLTQKLHLSFGGGITFFSAGEKREETSSSSSSSSDSRITTSAFIPNAQASLNFNIFDLVFLRAGYRCDIYPENYINFFSKSYNKPNGSFLGHSLIFGIILNVTQMSALGL